MKNADVNGKERTFIRRIALFVCILLLFTSFSFSFCGCAERREVGFFLSGNVSLNLLSGNVSVATQEIVDYLNGLESKISVRIETSEIYRLNKLSKGQSLAVSDDTAELFRISKKYYEKTDKAFNPATFPLTELWGFSDGNFHVPTQAELDAVCRLCDFNEAFSIDGNTITKRVEGAALDFGGIAKGYAADKCAEIAKKNGVVNGIIDIAGSVWLLGDKNGLPFTVGITDPRTVENSNVSGLFCKVEARDVSFSSSGDYRRFFTEDGKRYCHIIDGRTGQTSRGLISATVFGASATETDVYSTVLCLGSLGESANVAFSNELKAIMISENGTYMSTLTDGYPIKDVFGKYARVRAESGGER